MRLAEILSPGLRPLVATTPKGEFAGVARSAINDTIPDAFEKQRLATADQYVAFLARASLGSETVGANNVTNLVDAHSRAAPSLEPSRTRGLLDIEAESEGDHVRVIRARLDGVSVEIAAALLDADLVAARIPFRVRLGGWGVITRDEAGRTQYSRTAQLIESTVLGVKYKSGEHLPDEFDGEREGLYDAERIIAVVTSKPLSSWIRKIETDDAREDATESQTRKG